MIGPKKLEFFVPGRLFLSVLMLVCRPGAYRNVEHLKGTSLGWLRPHLQTLDKAGEALQEQIL